MATVSGSKALAAPAISLSGPSRFATCDSNLLGIAENQALFALLGTTYGSNGQPNFALPDLRGRVVMGA